MTLTLIIFDIAVYCILTLQIGLGGRRICDIRIFCQARLAST